MRSIRSAETEVKVLWISSSETDTIALRRILDHTAWKLEEARTLGEALERLSADLVPVVICNYRLPDGTWRDLLAVVSKLPNSPNLIVASPRPDDSLWMEVLDSGAYDLLATPLKAEDVFRITSLAWLNWRQQSKHRERLARKPAANATPAAQPGLATNIAHH